MPSKRRLTRAAVVSAAAEQLDQTPSEEISLAEVARGLGVRTPSLYNHVGSLDELRQAVAVLGVHELADRLGTAAIGRAGADALMAIAWAYRDFARQHRGLYQATQRAPKPGQVELAAAAEQVLDILRRVLEPFGLSEKEQIHAIRALRSLVHGFVSLEQAGGFGMPVDLDESFQYLVDLYIRQVSEVEQTSTP